MHASLIFLILAAICFFLAALSVPFPPRINLTALGLGFLAIALMVTGSVSLDR